MRRGRLQSGWLAGTLLAAVSCGSGRSPNAIPVAPPPSGSPVLTQADVEAIVEAAASAVNVPLVIAVSDRRGYILAIYHKANAPATATGNFGETLSSDDVAAGLARTAAYFSNDQAPIGTRTVRFLSGIHFPPGIANTASAPLYGIENTNRGCSFNVNYLSGQSLPVPVSLEGTAGPGMVTGKADVLDSDPTAVNPGGVPIFKNNQVAGGVGVVAADPATEEYAAFAATFLNGFGLNPVPAPGFVVVGGVTLPFVEQTTLPAGETTGTPDGSYVAGHSPVASNADAPEGDLIAETGSTMGGLTQAQVNEIVQAAIAMANQTRAAIRLPVGSRARFVIAIADLNGNLLALYRMKDATMFSVDVAVAKSRNVIYFTSGGPTDLPGLPAGTAVTNRTLGFAAQPLYPSGINGTQPGPFYNSLFLYDLAHPCTQGSQPANLYQNGVVFFPGSTPLYVNGTIVGGLGISGDGVDQDDFVAAAGAGEVNASGAFNPPGPNNFAAPSAIQADNYSIGGVRLPYQKFPRNPTD